MREEPTPTLLRRQTQQSDRNDSSCLLAGHNTKAPGKALATPTPHTGFHSREGRKGGDQASARDQKAISLPGKAAVIKEDINEKSLKIP